MNIVTQKYYGHGKLLLTGEYAVLDGAKALAIPTKFGQHLQVTQIADGKSNIQWDSFDLNNKIWLEYNSDYSVKKDEHLMLEKILLTIDELNPLLFKDHSYHFTTNLEFDRKWGLGSSSTLLYCLSQWSGVDMFTLLEKTFGGSGYDLASASCDDAIFYSKNNNKATWESIDLKYNFTDNLYFVYLGKKKNSREAISHYRMAKSSEKFLASISNLSIAMFKAKNLVSFKEIMIEHETILSKRLLVPTLNGSIFKDNKDIAAKSLGGWGGDFAMIATNLPYDKLKKYLLDKNLDVLLKWDEMIF